MKNEDQIIAEIRENRRYADTSYRPDLREYADDVVWLLDHLMFYRWQSRYMAEVRKTAERLGIVWPDTIYDEPEIKIWSRDNPMPTIEERAAARYEDS